MLIVSYYFPPLGGIASLRMTGHALHLPEHGWETVVLAPRTAAYHRDHTISFPEERVIRTRSVELSRVGKRALRIGGDAVDAAAAQGPRRWLQSAARSSLYYPDAQIGWAPFAVGSGIRALRSRPVDVLLSSSSPVTAHLIARSIARRAGVPWVAEFRDPWSQMLAPGRSRRRAARLEGRLARAATTVLMTSPSWADRHAALWGREVGVLPNGHDIAPVATEPPADLIIGYLGSYYGAWQARLDGLLEAMRTVCVEGRRPSLRIIGEPDPDILAAFRARGLRDMVTSTGFVPHEQAIARLRECSVALLAGPSDPGDALRGHVPAKVWEYLATDLPILCISTPGSDVAAILEQHEGTAVVGPDDVAEIAGRLSSMHGTRHARDVSRYSRRARAGALADVLDRACKAR